MRRPLQSGWRTGTEKVGPWNTAAWKGRRVGSEVAGAVNYIADMSQRPRFHANDTTRDVLQLDPRTVSIEDARSRKTAPSIDREGFALAAHESAVADFRDPQAVARTHYPEIERLLLCVSGADRVVVTSPGVLRFSEHSLRLRAPRQLPPRAFHSHRHQRRHRPGLLRPIATERGATTGAALRAFQCLARIVDAAAGRAAGRVRGAYRVGT